jgi:hypothetical protein
LHEIAAGLVPRDLADSPSRVEIVTRAQVVRVTLRATPSPAPAPTAIAPPQRVASPRRSTAARTEGRHGGHGLPRAIASAQPPARLAADAKPVWDVPSGRAASGASLAETGAAAGTGTGSGTSGSGAASGDEPCGFVVFSDPHGSHYDPRTRGFWVDIRMSVHFADGSSQSMILDYPWYYASEAANPWSDQNLRDPNFPMRFQAPPPEKAAAEPELVRYVIDHSTAEGMTLLKDCPQPSPTPAP